MLKKWLSVFCIFLPAALALLAAHAMANTEISYPTVCAGPATVSGVDVSDHQNTQSWGTALQSGRQYAFVKATEGTTFINADFKKDWAGTRQAGVLRGSYHFLVPADDPTAQADQFLATTGTLQPDDLPPVLDWETADPTVTSEQLVSRAQVWLDRVQKSTGRTPIIYTNPSYWQQLGSPAGFDRYPLFIADYDVQCPRVPLPWKMWTFWQHAIGAVTGIQNNTDQDFFNGLLAALKLL